MIGTLCRHRPSHEPTSRHRRPPRQTRTGGWRRMRRSPTPMCTWGAGRSRATRSSGRIQHFSLCLCAHSQRLICALAVRGREGSCPTCEHSQRITPQHCCDSSRAVLMRRRRLVLLPATCCARQGGETRVAGRDERHMLKGDATRHMEAHPRAHGCCDRPACSLTTSRHLSDGVYTAGWPGTGSSIFWWSQPPPRIDMGV